MRYFTPMVLFFDQQRSYHQSSGGGLLGKPGNMLKLTYRLWHENWDEIRQCTRARLKHVIASYIFMHFISSKSNFMNIKTSDKTTSKQSLYTYQFLCYWLARCTEDFKRFQVMIPKFFLVDLLMNI